jgi:hypothetical protein
LLATMFFQAITGAQTPACLFAASNSVETVTPPLGSPAIGRKTLPLFTVYAQSFGFTVASPGEDYSPEIRLALLTGVDAIVWRSIDAYSLRSMPSRICFGVILRWVIR